LQAEEMGVVEEEVLAEFDKLTQHYLLLLIL
jgi:hypothetical protein